MTQKIFLIAGEASGDALGAGVMRALKDTHGHAIAFFGVGGEQMEAAGLTSLFNYRELSLMGFAEIIPHMFTLKRRINEVASEIERIKPDVVVTIDSPGFNFRVIKQLKKRTTGKPVFIHLVAPTVWAYKPERAKKCAELFDHLLVILPFEPPYFEKEGLKTTTIGHPTAWPDNPKGDGRSFRNRYDIGGDVPVLTVLPGSRPGEIKRHMPIVMETIRQLGAVHPDLTVTMALPDHIAGAVGDYTADCAYRIIMAKSEEKMDAIAAANVALVKSGTVTLDVAHAGIPMIVMYRVNPLSAWLLKRMMLISTVTLVNILEEKQVVPEYLQENANADNLSAALRLLLASKEEQARQKNAFKSALAKLQPAGKGHPASHAAQAISDYL